MILEQIKLMMPEIIIATGICTMVLCSSIRIVSSKFLSQIIAVVTLMTATASAIFLLPSEFQYLFNYQVVIDPLTSGLRISSYIVVFIVIFGTDVHEKTNQNELFLIELFATLGISIICSAANLLIIYLGLELLALSLYALVTSNKHSIESTEAGMKFFILGAIASAVFLYGISLIYGTYETLNIHEINNIDSTKTLETQIALGFLLCGIAFKFGAIPFHTWVPDAYQGASTSAALFISTAPKIAAFALLYRILIDGFMFASETWTVMIQVLGILSLILGNLIAISQTNMKRLLGYSAIGHVGFIFLGISTGTKNGLDSSLFYVLIYVLMMITAFMSLEVLSSKNHKVELISDLKGLNSSHPWFALIMLFVMFSMIGIPPFAGFFAKWSILSSLVDANMIYTAIIAIIMSVVAAFYYLRVVWYIYFEKTELSVSKIRSSSLQQITVSCVGLFLLFLGLMPKPLLDFCNKIISSKLLID
jgi:NADH-quinone oxidoreductase subunit N